MEMLCPECLGPLKTADGKTARCTLHGGDYRILFCREEPTAAPRPMPGALPVVAPMPADASPYASPAPDVRVCPRHPSVFAPHTCRECLTPICETCSFLQPDGWRLCPDCASPGPRRVTAASRALEGVKCTRHPDVPAVVRCQACSKPICATCDFCLPGQVHVCPDCVSRRDDRLSSKRKNTLTWSFVLAVVATLGFVVMLSGAFAGMADDQAGEQLLGLIFSGMVFLPSLVGTALSVGTLDKNLSNPALIWVSVVWNGLLLAAFIALSVIGTFMG